jgi:hypothetical protein
MALDVVEETGQPAGTVAGLTAHGSAEPRGQSAVLLSVLFEGRFGRMFRDPTIKIVPHTDNALIHLGKTMREPERAGAEEDNSNLPAAYTYLYQWTDRRWRGIKLLAGRNPARDVDGTRLTEQDPQRREHHHLPAPPGLHQAPRPSGGPGREDDVAGRHAPVHRPPHVRGVAALGPLALPVDGCPRLPEAGLWARGRRQHPQERGCPHRPHRGPAVLPAQRAAVHADRVLGGGVPLRPLDGPGQLRPQRGLVGIPTFVDDPDVAGAFGHLGGFRRLPEFWTMDWGRFVKIGNSTPQLSRKINTKLTKPLQLLPPGLGTPRRELAVLNLLRGKARSLPSGQSVAKKMGIPPLTAQQLGLSAFVPNVLTSAQAAALSEDTPLWYYILKEAEIAPQGGARIVAEVLIGLLDGDPTSYLSVEPTWKPPGKVGTTPFGRPGDFTLAHLLDFATP